MNVVDSSAWLGQRDLASAPYAVAQDAARAGPGEAVAPSASMMWTANPSFVSAGCPASVAARK